MSRPSSVSDVVGFLESLAPPRLAEKWDNVGLLWGDPTRIVSRVMTCLTLTQDVADEAVRRDAQLIVSHHPILFRPVQRLTTGTAEGRTLLTLAASQIAVASAHTAYDSAVEGINRGLAETLQLQAISVLRPGIPVAPPDASPQGTGGAGRYGDLTPPRSLRELLAHVRAACKLDQVQFVGSPETRIERVAVACGAAAEFLADAIERGCQALVTGEARFHACIEARERGIALILLGHFASERPAMLQLAEQIGRRFPSLEVWASAIETDPIQHA